MVWEFVLILLLIGANGLFAGAEIAIVAARRGRLQQLADSGDRNAKLALELANNPNRFLSTVQVGITLVGTFAAACGGASLVGYLADGLENAPVDFMVRNRHRVAFAVVVLSIAFLQLVLGELVPKRIALYRAESIARLVAPVMSLLSQLARPVVWVLGVVTDGILLLLRVKHEDSAGVSVADIEHLIDTGTAEGTLEPVEQKVAREALRLSDRTVRDIMRPRVDLDALDVDTPQDEVIGAVAMAGFSRLPVYEKDLDRILGYVHMKDLFCVLHLGRPLDLRTMLHPALFVPESMRLDMLLEQFQEKHTQLAIVVDEHGGTDGLVTMEDVLEELVGEIRDEHRRDIAQEIVKRDDDSWLVDGGVGISDLLEQLQIKNADLPSPGSYSTVSGLILTQLGQIPSIGTRTAWGGLGLEVVDMDGQRIDRVLVSRLNAPQPAAE